VIVADLVGTAVFASEGALIAISAGLDLLGIVVIAFVVAVGGGMLRDVLLGATPPAALRDARYPAVVLAAAAVTIAFDGVPHGTATDGLLVLDAAGLALFTAAGTQKALNAGLGRVSAAMLGTITATGGGAMRDVLLAHVPAVLRVDFYATAALAGAAITVLAHRAGAAAQTSALLGAAACFALRLAGARLHWHLPVLN